MSKTAKKSADKGKKDKSAKLAKPAAAAVRRGESSMAELAGRAALLLGASSGIGLASALLLARRGAAVCIVSNDDKTLKIAQQAADDEGLTFIAINGDAAKEGDIRKALAAAQTFAEQHEARLNMLVSSVAMHPYGDAVQTTPEIWRKTLDTNFTSAFLLSHYGLPLLLKQGGGTITLVASVQGIACQQEVCAYSSCKAALMGLARSIAVDFGARGVRCNAVCPGAVETPMLAMAAAKFFPELDVRAAFDKFGQGAPLKRCARAEEIAELVAFVATERGSYCNGASLVADGGVISRLGFY